MDLSKQCKSDSIEVIKSDAEAIENKFSDGSKINLGSMKISTKENLSR